MDNLRNNILTVFFRNEISFCDLPLFRGAVINTVGTEHVLFHNHDGNNYRYNYPLVQYKRIGGKAAIVCLSTGVEVIGEFFSKNDSPLRIGEKYEPFIVDRITPSTVLTQIWHDEFTYTIRKYLPLNQENYFKYKSMESLADKLSLLERCLTGNILSYGKSLGIHFDANVTIKITKVDNVRAYRYKDIKMQGFDIEFKSNVSLPNYIGLGKKVSVGFGTVYRIK